MIVQLSPGEVFLRSSDCDDILVLKSIGRIDLNLCLLESMGISKAIYVHFSPIKGYYNTEIICTKNVHDM